MSSRTEAKEDPLVNMLIQQLESLQQAGITHMAKARTTARENPPDREFSPIAENVTPAGDPAEAPPAKTRAPAVAGQGAAALRPVAVAAGQDDVRCAALAALAGKVAACTRCRELAETRTQTVFGVGNPYARLVFCGEAPGADEDRLGEPFVGRAGQLLTDILVKGMKIRREDVYILNILRCRPPGNRNPLPVEAAACREYLDKQLEIIQPEFICCLGSVAAQNLLDTDTPIGRLRGRVHDYEGIKVVCTYHPAYLLRNPQAKKPVWDDIQMLMAEMQSH